MTKLTVRRRVPADNLKIASVRRVLRSLIEQDGRSQAAIAEAAGMSQSQLSHVLTGHRASPAADTVARILSALGKRWADLD